MKRKAFTLVELLVVVAIIGLLSSVAVISAGSSRDKARLASGQQFNAQVGRVLGDTLIGAWGFDECSGSTFRDSSNSGNSGSFISGVSFSTTTPTGSGCSLSFNGSGYANTTGPTYPNGVTVSLWMNTTNIAAQQALYGQNNPPNFLNIWMPGDGTVRFETAVSSSFYSVKKLAANKWYHIVVSFDPTAATGKSKIYIDGALDSKTDTTWSGGSAGSNIFIGAFLAGQYMFNGYIDDVRIYSSPLVASEIGKMYAEGAPSHGIFLTDNRD